MKPQLAISRGAAPVTPDALGPWMDAEQIVREFYTDVDGRAVVKARWVRENLPGRVVLSRHVVRWRREVVVAHLAQQGAA